MAAAIGQVLVVVVVLLIAMQFSEPYFVDTGFPPSDVGIGRTHRCKRPACGSQSRPRCALSRWPTGTRGPTFLVIGAAKAGTTSVYHHLSRHPEVLVTPQKETNFFAFEDSPPSYSGPGDSGVNEASLLGSMSTLRRTTEVPASSPGVGMPLIPVLPRGGGTNRRDGARRAVDRDTANPTDRAYSNYLHLRFQGREPLADFEEALTQEEHRREAGWEWFWRYADIGAYGRQLAGYLTHFSREQLLVVKLTEFQRSPATTMSAIFAATSGSSRACRSTRPCSGGGRAPATQPTGRCWVENRPNPVKTRRKSRRALGASVSCAEPGYHSWNSSAQAPPRMTLAARRRLLATLELDTRRAGQLTGVDSPAGARR